MSIAGVRARVVDGVKFGQIRLVGRQHARLVSGCPIMRTRCKEQSYAPTQDGSRHRLALRIDNPRPGGATWFEPDGDWSICSRLAREFDRNAQLAPGLKKAHLNLRVGIESEEFEATIMGSTMDFAVPASGGIARRREDSSSENPGFADRLTLWPDDLACHVRATAEHHVDHLAADPGFQF